MLPTSTIRGFFEILMPGVFLVINVALTVFLLIMLLMPPVAASSGLADLAGNQVIVATLVFVFGYPAGMALRLLKTSSIDAASGRYIRFWWRISRKDAEKTLFGKKRRPLTEDELAQKKNETLFMQDHFFYGNWMVEKLRTRMPAEMLRFYNEFWADKYGTNANQNTSWFNFCKTFVAKEDPQSGSEVYAAEAVSRFLAGMYYALQISVILLLGNLAVVILHLLRLDPAAANLQQHYEWITLIATLLVSYFFILHILLKEFRALRAKEVDTVFNAAYANRKKFEKLFPSTSGRRVTSFLEEKYPRFARYRDMILDAWESVWDDEKGRLVQGINLKKLTEAMRKEQDGQPPLSSLYFAGSENDHPFFLNNRDVAIGLAVLPEDEEKSGRHKRHPKQTEFFVVLSGAICVHTEMDGQVTEREVRAHDFAIVPRNTCHWVTPAAGQPAVYMFVKTNPSEDPRAEYCSLRGL